MHVLDSDWFTHYGAVKHSTHFKSTSLPPNKLAWVRYWTWLISSMNDYLSISHDYVWRHKYPVVKHILINSILSFWPKSGFKNWCRLRARDRDCNWGPFTTSAGIRCSFRNLRVVYKIIMTASSASKRAKQYSYRYGAHNVQCSTICAYRFQQTKLTAQRYCKRIRLCIFIEYASYAGNGQKYQINV